MKNTILFLFLAILFVECHRAVEPVFEEPPIGTAYLMVEYDGKKFVYIEGKNAEPAGNFVTSVKKPDVVGLGGSLRNPANGTDWAVYFYFKREELEKNTGNFTKLFDAKKYEYVLLDQAYEPLTDKGVVISVSTPLPGNPTAGTGSTSLIQEDKRPRLFEVKKAYFYNATYDRFIWVEGTFETWMSGDKKAKGQFRIKIQHDLQ